jgi:hypothetical protein
VTGKPPRPMPALPSGQVRPSSRGRFARLVAQATAETAVVSDVDQQQRRPRDPRAAVLSTKPASLLGDLTARLARQPERPPATSTAVEIRDDRAGLRRHQAQPRVQAVPATRQIRRAVGVSEWRFVATTHNLHKLHNHWIAATT